MRVKTIDVAGRELVSLSGEGQPGRSTAEQVAQLLHAFDAELNGRGLALENAVRQRLWMRDRAVRAEANAARSELLSGERRSSSSSFFDAARFAGGGAVAMDVIVQRPRAGGARRAIEFQPPLNYLYYLVQDATLFVSGIAIEAATLDGQFAEILKVIDDALARERAAWRHVVHAGVFLERGHGSLDWIREGIARRLPVPPPVIEYQLVDGLANPGKHLEIEITALLPA